MKLLKSSKGQLLIYFLVIMTLIAMVIGTYQVIRVQEIKKQLRTAIISELKGECSLNMGVCRVAAEDYRLFRMSGRDFDGKYDIKTKALQGFSKISVKEFRFSPQARLKWQEFVKALNVYGLINSEEAIVDIDPRDLSDIYNIYHELNLFLVKCQANNYNFEF